MPDKAQIISGVKGLFILAQEGLKGIGKFPGAEAIAGVPLRLIELYENISQNSEDLLVLLQHFKTLYEIVLEPIIKTRGENVHISEDDYRRIDELKTALANSVNALVPLTELKWYERTWKQEMIASTLSTCRWSIVHAITEFQVKGQITIHQLIRSVHDQALLSSLRPATARFDASNKLPCTAGTRTSVLDDIHRHFDNPNNFLVCLFGSPGTGKSAVAKSIALHLHEQHHLAASHFFDKSSGSQNADLRAFVSSIAVQLASFSPEFCTALIQQLDRDPLLAQASAQDQLRELLLQPLGSLVAPRKRFTVVVDALDESGNWFHQDALMKLLRDCVELRSHLILFITARPETPFTSVLSDEKLDGLVAVERLEPLHQTQTRQDIEVFVVARFQAMLDQHLHASSEPPSQNDVAELGRLSGDLFELAAIRLRQIEELHFYHPLQRAVSIVLTDGPSLGAGEDSLVQIYKAVLKSAFPDINNTVQRKAVLDEYHTVVGALACLYEPLGLHNLAALLGMTDEAVRSRLRPLSSVISVTAVEPIHFYHSSFLEFLLSNPSSSPTDIDVPSEYYVNSNQVHAELATRSLITMNESSGLTRNPLNLSDPYILNEAIPDLPKLLDGVISRHLRYACLYWAKHLRAEHSSQCHAPLVEWCEEKIVFYIEALSLLGEVERAIPLLLHAEDWARKANLPVLTVTFLYDARRLVPTFHTAITQSAGAIYSSVLPFMPECLLHERYHHLADGQVVLVNNTKRPPAWPSQIWSQAHPGSVWGIAVSPDGRHVASACYDSHVRILSAATGKIEQTLKGHCGAVRSVAFSYDGAHIVSASDDCSLCVWLSATGELERMLEGHSRGVRSVGFSPNNLRVVSGSWDHTLRIWSVATGAQERVLEGHTNTVRAGVFSPNGLYIVSGSEDRTIRIWSAVAGVQERVLTGHEKGVTSIAVSSDGTRIVSGSEDGSVRIWSAASGATEFVMEPQLQASIMNPVAFSPDREHVVSVLNDSTIRVWSTITGAEERVLEGHRGGVPFVAFFPDGKHIASGSNDGSVRVWSISSDPREPILDGHSLRVNSIAFSTDGAHVVSASDDRLVRVWLTVTGAQEQILEGHDKAVNAASFSPDGARIVSGSDDCSIRVWSAVTGAQEPVFVGHRARVTSVAFSPDGRQIVSGSGDGSVRVWSVATRMQEQVVNADGPAVVSVAFSLDGRHIVVGAGALSRFGRSVSVRNATTGAQEKQFSVPERQRMATVFFAWNDQVVGCVDRSGRAAYWDVSSGLALDGDDARIPLPPWIQNGYYCSPDGWLTVNGHIFWVPRYFHGQWWAHPSGVVILAPDETEGNLVFIKLPGMT